MNMMMKTPNHKFLHILARYLKKKSLTRLQLPGGSEIHLFCALSMHAVQYWITIDYMSKMHFDMRHENIIQEMINVIYLN